MPIKYLSVCSGMEAATVAWHHMGWQPVGFSEIEPFPSAILKHHYTTIPNYGDLTQYKQWPIQRGSVDLLVGGTPCQSFSVAGLRKGMEDPRGNLALIFLGLADKLKPRWIVWENVQGVLSSNGGRDFGSFLGALGQLGYGWAYRTLDAQHFGVPQRRRRVFVVACLGDWQSPAKVLFESDCLRRDIKKGRKKGQSPTASVEDSVGADGKLYDKQAIGQYGDNGVASTCAARDYKDANYLIVKPVVIDRAAFNQGQNAQYEPHIEETDVMDSLVARGPHAVGQPLPIAFKVRGGGNYSGTKGGEVKPDEKGGTGYLGSEDKTFTVASTQDQWVAAPIPFRKSKWATSTTDDESWVEADKSNTLNNFDLGDTRTTHAVVYENHPNDSKVTWPHDVAPTVVSRFGTGGGNIPFVNQEPIAFQPNNLRRQGGADPSTTTFPTLKCDAGDQSPHVATQMAVRRLTPVECERLQGFPDNWSRIPWKGKSEEQCPDGPRYKACGNSMAVPVMRWIGERIQKYIDKQNF